MRLTGASIAGLERSRFLNGLRVAVKRWIRTVLKRIDETGYKRNKRELNHA